MDTLTLPPHLDFRDGTVRVAGTRINVQTLYRWRRQGMAWETMPTIATTLTPEGLAAARQYIAEHEEEFAARHIREDEEEARWRAEHYKRFPESAAFDRMTSEERRAHLLAKLQKLKESQNGHHPVGG